LVFDALSLSWKSFFIKRDPANPLNGDDPSIKCLIDYDEFCNVAKQRNIKEISVQEFYHLKSEGEDFQLIDVREPDEYSVFNIEGDLVPLKTVFKSADKIKIDKKVIFYCQSGSRSKQAITLLQEKFGFQNLYNLTGGLAEYGKLIKD